MLSLPEDALLAISRLNHFGYEAYAVGGCVRDLYMKKAPKDIDITTNALPENIMEVFSDFRIIPTGLSHGTVTVVLQHGAAEITTFRTDGVYADHRRPESVQFVSTLKEDLSRRDFTMNAMAAHPDQGIIDLFKGREDIEKHQIRAVGDAGIRFEEDALRILRAYRFMARYEFSLTKDCEQAACEKKELLRRVSAERIFAELKGILGASRPSTALEAMKKNGVLNWIFPDKLNISAVDRAPKKAAVRLALLFSSLSPSQAEAVLRTLKSDRKTQKKVSLLLSVKVPESLVTRVPVKKSLNRYGADHFFSICQFQASLYPEEAAAICLVSQEAEQVLETGECCSLSQLNIDGNELRKIGIVGQKCGKTLSSLLDLVIAGELKNDKNILLQKAAGLNQKNAQDL